MFIPLYPAGILSECWLIYNVIEPSRGRQAYYQYLLWFGLLIYIPGMFPFLPICINPTRALEHLPKS